MKRGGLPPLVDPGPPLTPEEVQRFSRQLVLPALGETGQRRLSRARVCVVGAGGLGSPALLYLAAAGIGTLGIVDDDDVDPTNLARQVLYDAADVGRAKVHRAAERLAALHPDVVLRTRRCRLTAQNARELLQNYDVVVDGTDNFPTRYLVNDACAHLGIPLVWGSVLRFDAQVSVFWSRPPATSDFEPVTLRDLFPAPPADDVPSCADAGVLGALCGQVGSLMAVEVLKLVTGIGEPLLGRVLVLDALGARWIEVPLRSTGTAGVRSTFPGGDAEHRNIYDELPPEESPPARAYPAEISADELAIAVRTRAEGSSALVLLDVRDPDERTVASIPGSSPMTLTQLLTESGRSTLPRHSPVVVYCRSGIRSALAARALQEAGFAQVRSLAGGIEAWFEVPGRRSS